MELDAKFGTGVVTSPHRIVAYARTGDEVSCHFLAGYARRAEENGDATLTPREREALAEVERLAGSDRFYLDMDFADGDIQFLNNRLVFHGRTQYVDRPAFDERRHLLRLWLSVPTWPSLPQSQVFHTEQDRRLWSHQRRRLMELPSTYHQQLVGQYQGLGLARSA
jgi:Taurine catabolism dioxygenase TauD, TfdA family